MIQSILCHFLPNKTTENSYIRQSHKFFMNYSLLFSLLILFFTACNQKSTELPEQMPGDFSLNYHVDGGLSNYFVDMTLHNDSLHLFIKNDSTKTRNTLLLTQTQKQSLYNCLKRWNLDRISQKTIKQKIVERGGRTLKVSWDNKEILLKDSHNSFIAEEYYENWLKITEELEKLGGISK